VSSPHLFRAVSSPLSLTIVLFVALSSLFCPASLLVHAAGSFVGTRGVPFLSVALDGRSKAMQQQQRQQPEGPARDTAALRHHCPRRRQQRWTTATCLKGSRSPVRSKQTTATGLGNNLFEKYDKPVVFVGCSSDASEMYGLASSFLEDNFSSLSCSPVGLSTSAVGETSTSDNSRGGIIQVASISSNALLEKDDLLKAIFGENRTYRWPNVVVVDLGDAMFRAEESSSDKERLTSLEEQYKGIARALYENGLLSIYVNVDPESSEMDEVTAERKSRLDEFFVANSDFEICIRDDAKQGGEAWSHVEWELSRLVARARLPPVAPGDRTADLLMGQHTFFLSLSFPDIAQVEPYVEQMCQDVDAMEYRTDLLECRDSRFDLLYGMQLLRRYCRPHAIRVPALPFPGRKILEDVMPIVYTVRTQNQAGTYPDDEAGIRRMFEMLEWGLRGGVEVLDVESAWDSDMTDSLLELSRERYSSLILGSHHVVGRETSMEDAVLLFEQCALGGRAHGAKVVLSIDSEDKDKMAYEAALIAAELAESEGEPVIPNISLVLGDVGQFSRVINLPFTPVTHESLPIKAAPGQMTANEIMATRLMTKIFSPKTYVILGHNIAYSVSPQMHNAAFAATRLPHLYLRADVETVEEFVQSDFFQSDDFGGASVTIPHKQAIIPHLDVLSDSAKAIGSVNTIIAREEFVDEGFKRVLYGDNTDWRGIYNPLNRLLGSSINPETDYALILGAGGTARAAAYVASELGLQRVYYNRTPSKAHELANAFGGQVISTLDQEGAGDTKSTHLGSITEAGGTIRVVISTLPASAKFVLPGWFMNKSTEKKPIIFDVNYKPFNTDLLLQTESLGCQVVRGSEMLWEQGVGQFELWTGRTAPYRVMKKVVLENCEESKTDAVASAASEK